MIAKPSSRAVRRNAVGSRHAAAYSEAAARIVAAARRHFFAHGFRNVTMDDLAADLEGLAAETAVDALENLKRLLACMQHHTAEIQPPFVRDIRRAAPQLFAVVERRRRDLIRRYFGRFFAEGRRRGIVRSDIRA